MDESIKSIAPYSDSEVSQALISLQTNEEFIKSVQFFYPSWSRENIILKLQSCKTCADFQVSFIEMIIKNSINNTMDSLEIVGLDTFDNSNCLYLSNHRDIFLDSALLQNHLYDIGKPFTEISLGDNLMVNETMKKVAKLNNMFTVLRNGSRSEILKNSINLSEYLRYSIAVKKTSSWIAHRNGRTKDGNDVTSPGLLKMLLLSGGFDIEKAILELNIVISTISYEYEPCAFEKANELSIVEKEGKYQKHEFENIYSILKGINEKKGNVKLVFEKLDLSKLSLLNNRKQDVLTISKEIDRIIHSNYQLWKTNYIAYDILYNETKFQNYYSEKDFQDFKNYLAKSLNDDIYCRVLEMYSYPIKNKLDLN